MTKMRTTFRAALESKEARNSLWRAVNQALDAGLPRDQALTQLEELRTELRRSGRGDEEDAVLEVMDCLVGWCSPHTKL